MTCAMSPRVRATMNAAAFRDGAGAVEPLSLWARRRRWPRPWCPNNSRGWEFEFADARVPVEAAGRGVVLVRVEEREAIGGVDGSHTIIAPAAKSIGLRTCAAEHVRFSLCQVIQRVAGKASGIANSREHV